MNRKRRYNGVPLRALTAAAVLALTTGLSNLSGLTAHAADAPSVPSQATIDATTAQKSQERPPANAVEQAIAQAKATQKNVPVDSLTTEYSETVATPDGHLALTSHLEQQRVRRGSAWQGLDATLVANPDGTFSPKSAAGQVALSKGGDGPLATMTSSDGKRLALSAPFALPTPTVSGDSAVYPSVAPDIDLKVTATKLGGLTTVLVVKTQAAAANPALKNLHFGTTLDGVTVKSDEHGNVTVVGTDGKPRWVSRTPQMWDSSTAPAAPAPSTSAPVTKTALTFRAAAADAPAPAPTDAGQAPVNGSATGPGTTSKVSSMPVKADNNGIDLTPDQDLLAHGTAPYYIDPDYLPWTLTGNSWTWVQSAHDGSNNWMHQGPGNADHPGVGKCGYYPQGGSCSPADIERSFYQFDISALGGAVIHSATMTMQEYYSADHSCTNKYPLNLYVTNGPIAYGTTWSNQPGQQGGQLGDTALVGGTGQPDCPGSVPFSFDITGAMKQYVNYGQLTFGLYGDESNQNAFKRFTYQPALSVMYDRVPNVPTNPSVWPAPTTVSPAATNQSCGDGNANDWAWLGAGSAQNNAVWLNATVTSPTQAQVKTWDHIWDYNSSNGASGDTPYVNSGGTTSFQLPAGLIQDGHAYGYNMQAKDGLDDTPWSASTPNCYFKVDLTPPTVTFPTTVTDTSKQFPPSGNGQTPQLYAGQSGGIPFTATDPNPSGGYTSGVACLRWSFDPQLVDSTWQCGSAMPSGQIQVTAGRWGTNVLYVQAEDNAGNLSPVAQYSFYAPWNPNSPAPTFGDVTGDALPDIVTADPNGDLRAYSIPATGGKAPLAAPKVNSPGHDSWANYRTTHRGSLRGGNNVDDLIVHKDGDSTLNFYKNPGSTAIGVFDSKSPLAKPACDPKVTDCTGYNAANWSTTLQIAASGDPSTSRLDTGKQFMNRTGLFTVETSPDSNGALWFYPTYQDATFGSPIKLAATGWKDCDLISPGDWANQGHPGLWARNRANGDLRGYTFTTITATVTDDFGNTTSYPTITGIATDTKIGYGITSANWPIIGSDGDLTGIGSPTLWALTPNGVIQTFTGHATTTDPYYTWTNGWTNALSVYAENSPVAYTAQAGKCMDIANAGNTNGTAVQLYDCNGSDAQKWTFEPDGSLRALGHCLDATGRGTANGTQLQIWDCGNGAPQQTFVPRPDGSLYNPTSGRCIDLPGGTVTNSARLQLYDCNSSPAQKWNALVRS
ncbi:ricin-type beta-trefoil lectin domain protein [Kitasatospora sp. NPDC089509]|uniref:ricin-type beta-trefoil lectin domain protein n=1 Tax=Kitasatospora sp. NPDC089509 TaxID=3364079 RepID=UPI0037F7A1A6